MNLEICGKIRTKQHRTLAGLILPPPLAGPVLQHPPTRFTPEMRRVGRRERGGGSTTQTFRGGARKLGVGGGEKENGERQTKVLDDPVPGRLETFQWGCQFSLRGEPDQSRNVIKREL